MHFVRFVLFALGVAALWVAVSDACYQWQVSDAARMPAADYLARFEPLRSQLAGVSAVSYLIDPAEVAALVESDRSAELELRRQRALIEYFLAQRALAPTRVGLAVSDRWVLGNFRDAEHVPSDWSTRGLSLCADAGNGLVLFRAKGK